MDEQTLVSTRRSLHGVAELLLAGPQYRAHGTIRLRVTPGGFGCVAYPARVEGTRLVWPGGQVALVGSCRELAAALVVDPAPPEGLYTDTSGVDPDEQLAVDAGAAELLADWFARGDAALRALVAAMGAGRGAEPGPGAGGGESRSGEAGPGAGGGPGSGGAEPGPEPVLWPEHFDLGATLDEVNYGVSPGDAGHPTPYAYVGPWTVPSGEFWNAPFGALRGIDELPDADAVTAFFTEARAALPHA